MKKTRVFLIDDNPDILQTLSGLIQYEPDLTVCGSALNASAALKNLSSLCPDIAIVDISLPDMNGLILTQKLLKKIPDLRILVVTMHEGPVYARTAFEAGAKGVLAKKDAAEKIVSAIHKVVKGETYGVLS